MLHLFTKLKTLQFFLILIISFLSPVLVSRDLTSPRVIAIAIALLLCSCSVVMLRIVFFFLVVLAVYGVIGVTYGYPNMAMIVAVFETDVNELRGFVRNIPIINWWLSIAFFVLSLIYYSIARVSIRYLRPKHQVLAWFFYLFFLINSFEVHLFVVAYNKLFEYKAHAKLVKKSLSESPFWMLEKTENYYKYNNYILVIGESVRADYMSVFGYKHNTTPFISKQNGVYFKRAYSPASSTVASLTRMLQGYNPQLNFFQPENNIITLAQFADYDTYWISNSGRIGLHDSTVSVISMRSDYRFFLNRGDSTYVKHDDLKMLEKFKVFFNQPATKPRFFVLHMTGSHPSTCKHMFGGVVAFNVSKNKEANCYLGTIKKLDTFIESIIEIIGSESYSLLYFSDHGVSVKHDGVRHSFNVKNNYHVPMFMINSDSKNQVFLNQKFSNMNFLKLFQSWVGVADIRSNSTQYNIFSSETMPDQVNVKVFNGEKIVDVDEISEEVVLD